MKEQGEGNQGFLNRLRLWREKKMENKRDGIASSIHDFLVRYGHPDRSLSNPLIGSENKYNPTKATLTVGDKKKFKLASSLMNEARNLSITEIEEMWLGSKNQSDEKIKTAMYFEGKPLRAKSARRFWHKKGNEEFFTPGGENMSLGKQIKSLREVNRAINVFLLQRKKLPKIIVV